MRLFTLVLYVSFNLISSAISEEKRLNKQKVILLGVPFFHFEVPTGP